MTHLLHFSIGPVQGFIGEARRTRDLWAGSFLLSWLSAQAMLAVEKAVAVAGGDPLQAIVFPTVANDDLMEAVRRHAKAPWGGEGRSLMASPHIGSVPNRFKASVVDSKVAKTAAEAAIEAVQDRWQALADEVWKAFVAPAAGKDVADRARVKTIWDRQIGNFWDISWVSGEHQLDDHKRPTDGAWLDQRKNWRTHYPDIEEGGDHCQLMGFYQELSGFIRARGEGEAQPAFWARVRDSVGPYNLRLRERLCAIAMVKRLFPVLFKGTLERVVGWVPADGAFMIRHWPSVAYVAAYPWILEAWRLAPEACAQYQRKIHDLTGGWRPIEDKRDRIYGETRPTSLTGGDPSAAGPATAPEDDEEQSDPRALGHEAKHAFFKLDGGFFHVDAIRSMDVETFHKPGITKPTATKEEFAKLLQERREEAAKALECLDGVLGSKLNTERGASGAASDAGAKSYRPPPPRASEFYAVLLADGDHIGKNLGSPGGEDAAKQGLAAFTERVFGILREHNGATIYAGGDDVLALLPLDTAIPAAVDLQQAYRAAFGEQKRASTSDAGGGQAGAGWTLSAAIVFAQYHIPLRAVLEKAHEQLDDVAKDRNGRDSLALAVLKPGGVAFDWVSAWDDSAGCIPHMVMDMLARKLQQAREFTTGFLYNIRDRYQPLFDGDQAIAVTREQMRKFLLAEHMRAGGEGKDPDGRAKAKADAEHRIADLIQIGYPLERKTTGAPQPAKGFNFDAGPLMRFLAEEGRWFMAPASTSTPAALGAEEQKP